MGKLRAHRKSRQGCGNCKLRKVKCDESKPKCKRCTAFGVFCNYDCKYSDLQPSVDGGLTVEILQRLPCSLNRRMPSVIAPLLRQKSTGSGESNALYQLRGHDLELLGKFQTRTVFTISRDKRLRVYQDEMIKLACSHPFLMHAVLSLTLMHDRYLSAAATAVNTKLSTVEAFHWYHGIALFNSKLSGGIQPSERDALWFTAILLGTIAFYYIEADTPEEAWPLKPPSPLDLNWLRMSDGKKEIWNIAQPMTAGSVFQELTFDPVDIIPTSPTRPGLQALPFEFIKLCGLDTTSSADDNPYHAAASGLAQTLNLDCKYSTIVNFMYFISSMRSDYKRLLEQKDPCALLLLAYWYAKICQCQHWWLWGRAALECQAICIYLERYHGYETKIQNLLQYPRTVCGIVAR